MGGDGRLVLGDERWEMRGERERERFPYSTYQVGILSLSLSLTGLAPRLPSRPLSHPFLSLPLLSE